MCIGPLQEAPRNSAGRSKNWEIVSWEWYTLWLNQQKTIENSEFITFIHFLVDSLSNMLIFHSYYGLVYQRFCKSAVYIYRLCHVVSPHLSALLSKKWIETVDGCALSHPNIKHARGVKALIWSSTWIKVPIYPFGWASSNMGYPQIIHLNRIYEPLWFMEHLGYHPKGPLKDIPFQKNISQKHCFNIDLFWLVVGPPLWKIWVRQLGWLATQYMGK